MIYKLHLTKAELETLAVAIEDHQDIVNHALTKSELPLSDENIAELRENQSRSAVIAEKLSLLTSYAVLIEKSVKARARAENQKNAYLKYIKSKGKASDLVDPNELQIDVI